LYLPLSLSTPIMAGGLVALLMKKTAKTLEAQRGRSLRGILFASGIVAGDALIGVLVAFLIGSWSGYAHFYDAHDGQWLTVLGDYGPTVSLIAFGSLAVLMARLAQKGFSSGKK
jgi:hypothetical protein